MVVAKFVDDTAYRVVDSDEHNFDISLIWAKMPSNAHLSY